MVGASIREHLILYRKQIRISGVVALLLGLLFIIAGVWGIQGVVGDPRFNYLPGGVLLILGYLMLR